MVKKIWLASQSPRRRALIAGYDIPVELLPLVEVDEVHPPHLEAGDIPLYIARLKMAAYQRPLAEGEVLVTADTIVWLPALHRELGKPKDEAEAREMLHLISGITHQVYTGVCVKSASDEDSFVSVTHVTFAPLTDEQIDYYITHYHPLDKAGAYGIQEWIGYVGCTRIEGSYFNVMGLPVQKLFNSLQHITT